MVHVYYYIWRCICEQLASCMHVHTSVHLPILAWPAHNQCMHMQCAVTKATCLELKKPQNCFCLWCEQAVLQVREKGTVQSHSLLQHNVVYEPLQHCMYLWYTSQPTHTTTSHTYCTPHCTHTSADTHWHIQTYMCSCTYVRTHTCSALQVDTTTHPHSIYRPTLHTGTCTRRHTINDIQ